MSTLYHQVVVIHKLQKNKDASLEMLWTSSIIVNTCYVVSCEDHPCLTYIYNTDSDRAERPEGLVFQYPLLLDSLMFRYYAKVVFSKTGVAMMKQSSGA